MTQTYDIPLSAEQIEALDAMTEIAEDDIAKRGQWARAHDHAREAEIAAALEAKLELARGAVATLRNLYT